MYQFKPYNKVTIMGGRLKVMGSFALLGFIAGVAANFVYRRILPVIIRSFPEILRAEWILSGFAGATLTTIVLVLWAYLSGPVRER
ncbi:MAG: hypothetical protein AOA65_0110 [Candidatus Bathyarchaeota archaeon BA1]|nr:MAG: hypothetical protein AOA65_0110 [Candidatus Bathyarchaeota archaeon BA1]